MAVHFGPELPPKMASQRAAAVDLGSTKKAAEPIPQEDPDVVMSDSEYDQNIDHQHHDDEHGVASNSDEEISDFGEEEGEPLADIPEAELVILGGSISARAAADVAQLYGLEVLDDASREATVDAVRKGLARQQSAFLVYTRNVSESSRKLRGVAGRMPVFYVGDAFTLDPSNGAGDICLVRASGKDADATIQFALNNRHLDMLEVR
ncbi:Hypothetical Protein FCC1311_019712 [Hondaea fermentalgiana]|uniref:Uncharacterized protein n=1 Tax=Hondaea fermentalgiana TaxID=2315210 RepID=A0A2R5G3Z5_9STRA|nr:Hypothetical Protein FCC1311_019712 [Hondaea fermentalgiana]|eukprot:GBG25752.1 Hypothetical Protein FCC1311_019712 [Hondaea fermentalgiana]